MWPDVRSTVRHHAERQFKQIHQKPVRMIMCLSGQYAPRPDNLPTVYIWVMQCGICGN